MHITHVFIKFLRCLTFCLDKSQKCERISKCILLILFFAKRIEYPFYGKPLTISLHATA